MMRPTQFGAVPPDALLVQRVAALSDKAALAELDARHGMTLYALAYCLLLDADTANHAVAMVFREVWRSAASFDGRQGTVQRWLTDLTRRTITRHQRAAKDRIVTKSAREARSPRVCVPSSHLTSARQRRWVSALSQLARVAAAVAVPTVLLT